MLALAVARVCLGPTFDSGAASDSWRPLAGAARLAAVLVSPLLVAALAGFETGRINSPFVFSADLANLVVPTRLTLVGGDLLHPISDRFRGNLAEDGAYLGLPLLAALRCSRRARRGRARAAGSPRSASPSRSSARSGRSCASRASRWRRCPGCRSPTCRRSRTSCRCASSPTPRSLPGSASRSYLARRASARARRARAARARRAVPGARRRHLARSGADSRGRARRRRVAHPPPRRGRARPARSAASATGCSGRPRRASASGRPGGYLRPDPPPTYAHDPAVEALRAGTTPQQRRLPRVPASQRRAGDPRRPGLPARLRGTLDPLGITPERVEGLLVYRL